MAEKQSARHLRNIPPDAIDRNPDNPRLIFRQDEMETLLVSIDKHGIQVPLSVYAERGRYHLIDGERRWRCALKLNLKTVPALIQEKPSPLENLLLMYNIHALREQWDYYTIASKLTRVIELFVEERGRDPGEVELSEATGLTRAQIRRCRLLIDLPDKFKRLLVSELELPKSQQKLSEDFFIEMERSLKTVTKRLPEYDQRLDEIRGNLITKFKRGAISAVTDFRQLSKIATAVDSLGVAQKTAKRSLDRIFDVRDPVGIREVYQNTVEFEYDEKKAFRQVQYLSGFFDTILDQDHVAELDDEFVKLLTKLRTQIGKLLRER
jgi:ParB family transcriptional regulator, chromosome partitioning protein